MELLLYLPQERALGLKLLETVQIAVPGRKIEICSSPAALSVKLCRFLPDIGLAEMARMTVPTSRELEDRDARDVTIWKLTG